jgi:thymidine phosphorylase
MRAVDFTVKKRDAKTLSRSEIAALIRAYALGEELTTPEITDG